MLLDPGFLACQCLGLVLGRLYLNLSQVVTELVICHNKGVVLASVLDAIRVIVVLGWGLHHDTFLGHLIQGTNRVRQLGSLDILKT